MTRISIRAEDEWQRRSDGDRAFARRAASRPRRATLLREHRLVRKHAFDPGDQDDGDGARKRRRLPGCGQRCARSGLAAATRVIARPRRDRADDDARAEWLARADQLGHHGLRVLACAMKMEAQPDSAPYEGLVLIGLIGLEDPARADVPNAIQDCHRAGIRVVMVTGDHAVTARSIGRAVGLVDLRRRCRRRQRDHQGNRGRPERAAQDQHLRARESG